MKSLIQILWNPPVLIFLAVILGAIGALLASKQQAIFERDLRIKSDEIAVLNKEIVNLVTGGQSFCYLSIGSLNPDNNVGVLTVIHGGDHPIYDVNARIVDLQKFEKIKDDLTFDNWNSADTIIHIGNMIKGTASIRGKIHLGKGNERGFNIFFSARNGLFVQFLRLQKVANKWVRATKVERDGKVLFEKVHENFPKDKEGNVVW
jgi:hypothetical protein